MRLCHGFGMFIHWGIYSQLGVHEQARRSYRDRAEYAKLADSFNPYLFDADEWVKLAKDAGMEYICFTAKHHDGFCMWDTAYTPFNIMNTPYGRDILAMLADACSRHGIALSLYYSIPDWNHPNAYNEASSHQLPQTDGDIADSIAYRQYIKNQMSELLTRYGKIYTLFWDIPPRIFDPSINEYVRGLQPDIIINNRGYDDGDFSTPERCVPEGEKFPNPTEACQSVGEKSWGWRENEDFFSSEFLMKSIDRIRVMGGSYLLNVGPTPPGRIDGDYARIIRRVGEWYGKVREAFVDTEAMTTRFSSRAFLVTGRADTVYLHFTNGLNTTGLTLEPVTELPRGAYVLNNGQKLRFDLKGLPGFNEWGLAEKPEKPPLHIYNIPVDELAGEVIVVRLDF